MHGARILVVEDEVKLAALLCEYLQRAGYGTRSVHDGSEALEQVRHWQPDLVLLDLMLPGQDGLDLCRELRQRGDLPVIITTARSEEIDRLLGLELGADDYICKPYSPREVVARVKAVLRRSAARAALPAAATGPADGDLHLDADGFRIQAGDEAVQLTTVEFHLFRALFDSPGRIFSRDQLMQRIYDDHRIVSDRTIDSHVKKLRRKIAALRPGQELIHSVYGAGYVYRPGPVASAQ
jgi:two-component system response regulator BaeR